MRPKVLGTSAVVDGKKLLLKVYYKNDIGAHMVFTIPLSKKMAKTAAENILVTLAAPEKLQA